jgi:hypothetical protein
MLCRFCRSCKSYLETPGPQDCKTARPQDLKVSSLLALLSHSCHSLRVLKYNSVNTSLKIFYHKNTKQVHISELQEVC